MACLPVIEKPELVGNDMIFRGHCEGECKDGACRPSFVLNLAGKQNKGARVTAGATWTGGAMIRITADSDIDEGLLSLECACGETVTKSEAKFSLEHRVTAEDVFKWVITLGVKAVVDKVL